MSGDVKALRDEYVCDLSGEERAKCKICEAWIWKHIGKCFDHPEVTYPFAVTYWDQFIVEQAKSVDDRVAAKAAGSSSVSNTYPEKYDAVVHTNMNTAFFKHGKVLVQCETHADWDPEEMGETAWVCVRDHLADIYMPLASGKREWIDRVFQRKSKKTGDSLIKDIIAQVKQEIQDNAV